MPGGVRGFAPRQGSGNPVTADDGAPGAADPAATVGCGFHVRGKQFL